MLLTNALDGETTTWEELFSQFWYLWLYLLSTMASSKFSKSLQFLKDTKPLQAWTDQFCLNFSLPSLSTWFALFSLLILISNQVQLFIKYHRIYLEEKCISLLETTRKSPDSGIKVLDIPYLFSLCQILSYHYCSLTFGNSKSH